MSTYETAWDLANAHIIDLTAILDTMGKRGLRVDKERLDEFCLYLDKEMAALQAKFDADPDLMPYRNFHPKQGYKKVPKDLSDKVQVVFREPKGRTCDRCKGAPCPICDNTVRWAKRLPFNANSSDQVKAFIEGMGHQVKVNKKGKATSDDKALMWGAKKYQDQRYRDFIAMRKLGKMRSTYGEWPLEAREYRSETVNVAVSTTTVASVTEGRFHTIPDPNDTRLRDSKAIGTAITDTLFYPVDHYITTQYTFRPETGRLSSTGDDEGGANLQNIPKRGPLAKPFRRCLVPSRGRKLVTADLASAEAVIIGWLSGDPLLRRLAPLGMHKFAMAFKLGIPVDLLLTDAQLSEFFDELKEKHKDLYNVVKTTVYGSFYLAGPKTLAEKNPEEFSGQAEAKQFQKDIFKALPGIQVWQRKTIAKEYRFGENGRNWGWSGNRLINPFGASIEYWDLNGGDAAAACAYLPQSTIGCVVKEAMLILWPQETGKWMSLQIHDELVADAPEHLAQQVAKEMGVAMSFPHPQLKGLIIPTEIAIKEHM